MASTKVFSRAKGTCTYAWHTPNGQRKIVTGTRIAYLGDASDLHFFKITERSAGKVGAPKTLYKGFSTFEDVCHMIAQRHTDEIEGNIVSVVMPSSSEDDTTSAPASPASSSSSPSPQ